MIDTAHFKTKLSARLAELENRLQDIEHDLDERPDPDVEERATEREADEVLEQLGLSGLAEIEQIKAALQRIDDGTYGDCLTCGAEILPARLEVVPAATQCRHCARR